MAEQDHNDEVVVPVVSEEVHADAMPVTTGGVRVVKRVEGHEEVLEQELRRGRVEVKRVKANRVVDGPQAAQRQGNTLVIPVVSEILRVTKEWVVTEEIHVTQIEDTERVQERVQVNREIAEVERTDEQGNVTVEAAAAASAAAAAGSRPGIIPNTSPSPKTSPSVTAPAPATTPVTDAPSRKVLGKRKSLLRDRT